MRMALAIRCYAIECIVKVSRSIIIFFCNKRSPFGGRRKR